MTDPKKPDLVDFSIVVAILALLGLATGVTCARFQIESRKVELQKECEEVR